MAANTLTVINRTSNTIGVAGRVIGPSATLSIALREVQGHPTRASKMAEQVTDNLISVSLGNDGLSAAEVEKLDAPVPGTLAIVKDVFVDVDTADRNGIKASFIAPAAATTYSGSDLDGVVGSGTMDPPRNITIYGNAGGGEALAEKDIVITGVDVEGNTITETITASALTGVDTGTDTGTTCFAKVTSIYVPADASGSPGDYEIGFGEAFGFSSPLSYGGLIGEFVDNAEPTAGTVATAANAAPNGSYTPHGTAIANGSRDYALSYVPD